MISGVDEQGLVPKVKADDENDGGGADGSDDGGADGSDHGGADGSDDGGASPGNRSC